MKAATVSEIRQELKNASPAQVVEYCLRLARYKKENKELLTYLIFESDDPEAYIKNVKQEIEENFAGINTGNPYYVKKSLRKILRSVNKYIKYTGDKQAEVELLIYFCRSLKESGIPFKKSAALVNLYNTQLSKINAAIATLHEDLQYDYAAQSEKLN